MRDLALLAALLLVTPLVVRAPMAGLLTWIWTSVMSPQREIYGSLRDANLNFLVAAATLLAWVLARERRPATLNPMTALLLMFAAWTTLTTLTALDRGHSCPFGTAP